MRKLADAGGWGARKTRAQRVRLCGAAGRAQAGGPRRTLRACGIGRSRPRGPAAGRRPSGRARPRRSPPRGDAWRALCAGTPPGSTARPKSASRAATYSFVRPSEASSRARTVGVCRSFRTIRRAANSTSSAAAVQPCCLRTFSISSSKRDCVCLRRATMAWSAVRSCGRRGTAAPSPPPPHGPAPPRRRSRRGLRASPTPG